MSGRRRVLRESYRRERLGPEARCRICGYAELAALTLRPDGIICYECRAAEFGRAVVEFQHLLGRKLFPDLVVGMPGNLHRVLDDLRECWPEKVRKNVGLNPLLTIVAYVLLVHDLASVAVNACQSIADWLIRLDTMLSGRHGNRWWSKLGLPALWKPKDDQEGDNEEQNGRHN